MTLGIFEAMLNWQASGARRFLAGTGILFDSIPACSFTTSLLHTFGMEE